jgi:uncharacterized protein YbjQ (UPF0145 family)
VHGADGPPTAATDRLLRFDRSDVRTSLLSVPATTALHGVGLEPLGDVAGTCGMSLMRRVGRCGAGGTPIGLTSPRSPVLTSGSPGTAAGDGLRPWVEARTQGFALALRRMLADARAVGADGVVDVRVSQTRDAESAALHAFVAAGTAVHVTGGVPPGVRDDEGTPFAATLDGPATARAVASGWWPAGVAVGLAGAIRHRDQYARVGPGQQVGSFETGEVVGLSDLLAAVRADARARLQESGDALRAEHLAVTRFDTRVRPQSISDHEDDVAETTILATALRHVPGAAAAPPMLAVLPLRDGSGTRPPRGGAR